MENRYYTPEIEEFHVGFEYEYYGDRVSDSRWHKTTFIDEYGMVYDRLNNYADSLIRVKYLDKEDIESLGFVYKYKADLEYDTIEHNCNPYQYLLKYLPLRDNSRDVDLKITYFGTESIPCIYKFEIYEKNFFEWETIFKGKVKNKHELEKLMKQLGINEMP